VASGLFASGATSVWLKGGSFAAFFETGTYRVTSHTESARKVAQTASLFICAKDFLALFLRVTVRLRVIATTATTVIAVITLFSISSQAIAHEIVTAAMATL
jgi:hypothetical protein